jgi:serine/threonine protein kinase
LTKQLGEGTVLGTADYLSPEQAIDSHDVDRRTDIYSLGATFYFLLTGEPPVPDVSVAKKLIFIQTTNPAPVHRFRKDVPAEMAEVMNRMLAKDPKDRPQTPRDVVTALEPWTQSPIAPPREEPGIRLSPLARGNTTPGGNSAHHTSAPGRSGRSRGLRNSTAETVITANRKPALAPAEPTPIAPTPAPPILQLRVFPYVLCAVGFLVVSALLLWQFAR